MDYIKVAEHLLQKLRKRKEDLSQTLATGGVQDIEQYQRIVGEIAGLNIAEQEIQTLNSNMEDIDD
jgi:ppGpp synthetase/RelA/SpoT-type nucleotidyltranferase|tara:strand:+ start:261 stop:458 length:198 start_codon:yes stop_codon:yes gene_type:complete